MTNNEPITSEDNDYEQTEENKKITFQTPTLYKDETISGKYLQIKKIDAVLWDKLHHYTMQISKKADQTDNCIESVSVVCNNTTNEWETFCQNLKQLRRINSSVTRISQRLRIISTKMRYLDRELNKIELNTIEKQLATFQKSKEKALNEQLLQSQQTKNSLEIESSVQNKFTFPKLDSKIKFKSLVKGIDSASKKFFSDPKKGNETNNEKQPVQNKKSFEKTQKQKKKTEKEIKELEEKIAQMKRELEEKKRNLKLRKHYKEEIIVEKTENEKDKEKEKGKVTEKEKEKEKDTEREREKEKQEEEEEEVETDAKTTVKKNKVQEIHNLPIQSKHEKKVEIENTNSNNTAIDEKNYNNKKENEKIN
ncbi:chascon isoform d-related [Anaeramoeba flamelloides]|uniref:Chascon isoform d-related n=1 Tax=Anaeramoeba flamelloides TaxID=1746091 RepID=A0AAV7YJH5_9EUKA|nr:chascon isoform d-related [Anaeramoeba flamelloides]